MSGPIIRKYGFPNFDQIFGKRELQHGVEDEPRPSSTSGPSASEAKAEGKTPTTPKAGAPE